MNSGAVLDELKWHEILFNSSEWSGEIWYFYLQQENEYKLPPLSIHMFVAFLSI